MREVRKPITILMAEDDPDDRLLTEDAFRESRLDNGLYFVEDGLELLDYLRGADEYADRVLYPSPDLILLDLNMPRLDGREALQMIKSDPGLRRIPVVVLTTSRAEEDILRSYNLGASGFIIKPVTFDKLVEIAKVLEEYWIQIVRLPPPLAPGEGHLLPAEGPGPESQEEDPRK